MLSQIIDDVRRDAIQKASTVVWTNEKSEELAEVIGIIEVFLTAYRKEGILILDQFATELEIKELYHEILRAGCYMICDFIPVEDMEEYLTTLYWTNEPKEEKALICYMAIRGMLFLADYENSYKTMRMLSSGIPKECKELCEKFADERVEEYQLKIVKEEALRYEEFERVGCKIRNSETAFRVKMLDDRLAGMADKHIMRFLYDVDNNDLLTSMIGVTKANRGRVFGIVSKRLKEMWISDLLTKIYNTDGIYCTDEDELKRAAVKTLDTILLLEVKGEFIR